MKYRDAKAEFHRSYWLTMLHANNWNVAATARAAGVNRTDIYKHFDRAGIVTHKQNRGSAQWQGLDS